MFPLNCFFKKILTFVWENVAIHTFLISAMISLGSLDEVVFMLQVKRRERGFTSALSFTTLLREIKTVNLIKIMFFVGNGLYSRNNLKTGYF